MPVEKDLTFNRNQDEQAPISEDIIKKYKILDQKCDEILNRIKKRRKKI